MCRSVAGSVIRACNPVERPGASARGPRGVFWRAQVPLGRERDIATARRPSRSWALQQTDSGKNGATFRARLGAGAARRGRLALPGSLAEMVSATERLNRVFWRAQVPLGRERDITT